MGKRNKSWVQLLVGLLAIMLIVSACGQAPAENNNNNQGSEGGNGGGSEPTEQAGEPHPLEGKRVALIMQFNQGTFSAQYVEGVTEQIEKFGGEVSVFDSRNDLAQMASHLDAAINQRFDGILIDHGQAEALEAGVIRALEQDISVVVFDADIQVDGAPVLSQNDHKMAELTLEALKEDIGGEGNIVRVWVAGFAPMERRYEVYERFMNENPGIEEIATFGNASNPNLDSEAQMQSILTQYPNPGDIAAVWTTWDEFAKGAARAIQASGRDEIKLYGIDLSDEDLQIIQDPESPWIATAAVDPSDIGRVQARILYQLFNGDQPEASIVLDPVFVSRDQLPEHEVSTSELSEYVEGWGASEQGYLDWMKELEEAVGN